MTAEKRLSVRKTVPLLLVGLSFFVLYLHFFVGIEKIALHLQRANLLYYSLAFVAVLLQMIFFSLAWQHFLLPLSIKPPFRKTFLYTWVGLFVDLLIPAEAVSGDISKAYLMSKTSEGSTGKIIASLVGHRILNMVVVLAALILGSTWSIVKHELPGYVLNLLLVVMFGTAITLFFICLLSFREEIAWKIIDTILRLVAFLSRGRWQLDQLRSKAKNMLDAFDKGIEVLGEKPKILVRPVIFSLASWFSYLLVSFSVFLSLGFSWIPLSVLIIVSSVSDSIQMVPLGVPGEVGLTDVVMAWLYTLLGLPPGTAAAATVLIRIVTLWFRLLVGYAVTHWVGVEVLTGK